MALWHTMIDDDYSDEEGWDWGVCPSERPDGYFTEDWPEKEGLEEIEILDEIDNLDEIDPFEFED